MALDQDGLRRVWDRMRTYVAAQMASFQPHIPFATTTLAGVVKPDGTSITVDNDGTIHGTEQTPIATSSVAGKVKPDGTTISVDDDGVISTDAAVRIGRVGNPSRADTVAVIVGDDSDGRYTFPAIETLQSSMMRYDTNIVAADFPNCSSVGDYAFGGCRNLKELSMPLIETVPTSMCRSLYSLETVYAPMCVRISSSAFEYCSSLTSISMPSCSFVGARGFGGCSSLSDVYLPSCGRIGSSAFAGCTSLSEISLPSCSFVADRGFYYCRSLQRVNLPSCTTLYYSYCFGVCDSLSAAFLPKCTTIGASAFIYCLSLTELYLTEVSNATWVIGTDAFYNTPMVDSTLTGVYGSIYVPQSLYSDFVASSVWTSVSSRIVSVTVAEASAIRRMWS